MGLNLDSEYRNIASELTRLVQDEIKRQGLVKTGRLLNSINFISTKTNDGYKLSMEAIDYFPYIDNKYGVLDNVFNSPSYSNIQDKIGDLTVESLLIDLDIKPST